MPNYKYNEDKYLKQISTYLDGTYGEHYVAKDIQVIDIWESLDTLETTSRDTAIKYLCRYGKKAGKNKKDLLKAIHYILLMMYASEKSESVGQVTATQDSQISITSKPESFVVSEHPFAKRGSFGTLYSSSPSLDDAYDEVNRHDSYIRKQ